MRERTLLTRATLAFVAVYIALGAADVVFSSVNINKLVFGCAIAVQFAVLALIFYLIRRTHNQRRTR